MIIPVLHAQWADHYQIESLGSLPSLASNEIYSVAQDTNDFIWVGTSIGLSRFDGNIFENYAYADTVAIGQISVIEKGSDGELYFGGPNGLFMHQEGQIRPVQLPFEQSEIITLKADKSGGLWVGGINFIPAYLDTAFLNGNSRQVIAPVIPTTSWQQLVGDQVTFKIETDPQGNVYFGTDRCLLRFNGKDLELLWSDHRRNYRIHAIVALAPDSIYWGGEKTSLRFLRPKGYDILVDYYLYDLINSPKGIFALHTDIFAPTDNGFSRIIDLTPYNRSWLQDIIMDREGNLWIGGHNDLIQVKPIPFEVYHQEQIPNQDDLFSVAQHPDGRLLLGGHRGRVYTLDSAGIVSFLPNDQRVAPQAEIQGLYVAANDWIWFGSAYEGIGLFRDGHLEYLGAEQGLMDNSCYFFYEEPDGTLWSGGDHEIRQMHIESDSTIRFDSYQAPGFGQILLRFYGVVADDEGGIWAGSANGLFYLEDDALHRWSFPTPLTPHPFITQMVRDQEGYLWLSTQGNGLWQCRFTGSGQLKVIRQWKQKEGLGAETWLGLHVDQQDRIWAANSTEICCLDKYGEPRVYCYNTRDGWPEFSTKFIRFYESSDQKIWVVGKNALVSFSPYTLHPNRLPPKTFIRSVEIMDGREDVFQYSQHGAGRWGLPNQLNLPYNKNYIRFNFTTTSLQNSDKNQFWYRLNGIEEDWQLAGASRTVSYPNLNPGRYNFEVLAGNNHGVKGTSPAVFSFVVRHPWWRSGWAYLGYIGLLFAVLFVARRQLIQREYLKNRLEIEGLRSRFFANISHEFRTPLTLIKAPLEDLLTSRPNDKDRLTFLRMHQNTERLLHLVNQLMDLSRLEAGVQEIHAAAMDANLYLRQLAGNFQSLAEQKKLDYTIDIPMDACYLETDADKLEKIVLNLLSNAFKFVPDNGWIVFRATYTGTLTMWVGNSGAVIPRKEQVKVFERFYQAGDTRHQGAGIGLALVRELVDLQGGKVGLESTVENGTWFWVDLPLKETTAVSAQIRRSPAPPLTAVQESVAEPLLGKIAEGRSHSKSLLLLVEDHKEVREYICSKLAGHFRIVEAENGQEGLECAIDQLPDLIISDVMMPVMDGITFCQKIKTDHRTDHIPLILLTAKADIESRIDGLEIGADDYLAKPFDSRELLVRSRNLIAQRERLQAAFRKEIRPFATERKVSSAEERFLQKAIATVEKHLDLSDFTVEDFAAAMQLSRVQLHRKLKAITGMSATDFVRNLRLEHAAQLLGKKSDSVSQIAYQVGFNNLSYFAKCFREKYGMPPSDFRENGNVSL